MRSLTNRAVLVPERDATDAFGLRRVLEGAGAEVSVCFEPSEALSRIGRFDFSAAVLDGIECADLCRALGGVPFAFYIGPKNQQIFPEWPEAPVLLKPIGASLIVETVASLIKQR